MSEKELKLFEAAMDLAVGECCSDNVEDIKKLEIKIKLIDGLYKQQKEVINKIKEYINPLVTDREDTEWCPINFYVKNVLLSMLKEVE